MKGKTSSLGRALPVAVGLAWLLGAAVLAIPGCSGGGGGSKAGAGLFNPSPSNVSISVHPATALDTAEGAGAGQVPLLGIVLENGHPSFTFSLASLRLHAGGDFGVVSGLAIFIDNDADARATSADTPVWTGAPFDAMGQRLATFAGIPLPFGETHVLVTCSIDPAAPVGSRFRAWVDGPGGDLGVTGFGAGGLPLGRATSGERVVANLGMATLEAGSPRRRAFTDPGMTNLPTLAATVRLTSVEDAQDIVFDLDPSGSAAGWNDIIWTLWLDGDADGARLSPSDVPIDVDFMLSPGTPRAVLWPGPLAAGDAASFLLTADIMPTAPVEGLFAVSLTIADSLGLSSGLPLTTVGGPVAGGLRVGTRGMVVTVGDDLAILDPDLEGELASSPGGWNASGGLAMDPGGVWVAIGSRSPDEVVLVDLRGLREIGRVTLLAPPVSMVVARACSPSFSLACSSFRMIRLRNGRRPSAPSRRWTGRALLQRGRFCSSEARPSESGN